MTDRHDDQHPRQHEESLGADVGALTPEEAREFEATLAELGGAVPPIAPPPELKRRIMDIVASTPQESAPAESNAKRPQVEEPQSETSASRVSSLDAARERRAESDAQARPGLKRGATWLIGAAAAAAFFVGGVYLGNTMDKPTAGGDNQPTATQLPQGLAEMLTQPDAKTVSAEVTGGGSALLVASADMGKSAVLLSDVPKPKSGEIYQLWYIQNGKATSAGIATMDNRDAQWFELDGTYKPGMTVGVTVEPEGGSEQPTTTPIVGLVA